MKRMNLQAFISISIRINQFGITKGTSEQEVPFFAVSHSLY